MSRRTKIIIILIAVIILFLIIFGIIKNLPSEQTPISQTGQNLPTTETGPLPTITVPTNLEPAPTEPQEENPKIIANIFTERYGSFSSQADFQNLRDLFGQMTNNMQQKTETLIKNTKLDSTTYSGITTIVTSSTIKEQNDSSATVEVKTQRVQSTAENLRARVYQQEATLKLVRQDLKWLVDDFSWKD